MESPFNSAAEQPRIISEMTQMLCPTCDQESQLVTLTSRPIIAFPSGPMIVLYDTQLLQQVKYVSHRTHLVTALAATNDGNLLAVADSAKDSGVSVYNLSPIDLVINKPQWVLPVKKGTISLLAFSPNGRYLVGVSNDENLFIVWEGDTIIVRSRPSSEPKRINRLIFAQDGNMLTAGVKHFKVWSFRDGEAIRLPSGQKGAYNLEGRNIGMRKDMIDKQFVNVASRNGYIVALTSDGLLCKLNSDWNVCQHAQTGLPMNALEIVGSEAIIGGKNADVRILNLDTLQIIRSFPKPPPLRGENIQKNSTVAVDVKNAKFPRCLTIRALPSGKIATLYDNKMLFVWVQTKDGILAEKSFLGHTE